jgi:hypothetical protein
MPLLIEGNAAADALRPDRSSSANAAAGTSAFIMTWRVRVPPPLISWGTTTEVGGQKDSSHTAH